MHHTTHSSQRAVAERILASDGFALSLDRYIPDSSPRGLIIVAGAIGVPQAFYKHFASFARRRQFEVVTFDYRGIGRSAPPSLRGFRASLTDWGTLDLAAVVERCRARAADANVPLYIVAHSFGGHAFGMLPNPGAVTACFTYGTGAGWHGHMPRMEQLRVHALWQIIGPALTAWKGYLPWSAIGMGEDLPRGVYRQWRQWCRYPHFFFDDPHVGVQMRAQFSRVTTRMLAVAAVDDRWSPPRSRDAFLTGYPNVQLTNLTINPSTVGLSSLGHMGYFRSPAAPLWSTMLRWLETEQLPACVTSESRRLVQDFANLHS